MAEITMGVSWLAVVCGAVGAFMVGYFWYSPMLFGKQWAEGHGIEMGTADNMPIAAMVTNFAGLFLMSWFVGVTAVSSALFTVILATLAFAVLAYSGTMFTKKPSHVGLIEGGYWVASLVVMIIFQAIF